MIFSFYYIALLFFIYSFLGWCIEVSFVAITLGRIENRGFLHGPGCPIYGIGMLGVLSTVLPLKENWILLFLGGMVVCTLVELIGGWALDKIFHMRWWDYSDKPLNINGYVCLSFSIMWGMGVLIVVKFVHPLIMLVLGKMPRVLGIILICVIGSILIADMIVTLKNLIGIKRSLGRLDKLAEELQELGDQIKDVVGKSAISAAEKAEEGMEDIKEAKEKFGEFSEKTKGRLNQQKEEIYEKRNALIEKLHKQVKHHQKSFPKLNKSGKSINIKEYINSLKKGR